MNARSCASTTTGKSSAPIRFNARALRRWARDSRWRTVAGRQRTDRATTVVRIPDSPARARPHVVIDLSSMGDRRESWPPSLLCLLCARSLAAACSSVSPVKSREGLSPQRSASSNDSRRVYQPPVSLATGTETDVFRAAARDRLKGSYYRSPLPCADFWARGGWLTHVVVDMAPWAAAAGL